MTATAARRREMWGRGRCCSWRLENWRYNPGPGLIRHVIWCVLTLLGRSRKDGCQLLVYLFTLGILWLFTFHTMRFDEALIHLTVFASYNLFSDILSLHLCCWGKKIVFFNLSWILNFIGQFLTGVHLAGIFCGRKNYRLTYHIRLHNKYIYVHNLCHKYVS